MLLRGGQVLDLELHPTANLANSRPDLDGNKLAKGMNLATKMRDKELLI